MVLVVFLCPFLSVSGSLCGCYLSFHVFFIFYFSGLMYVICGQGCLLCPFLSVSGSLCVCYLSSPVFFLSFSFLVILHML